jgi:murein hydrolase activator
VDSAPRIPRFGILLLGLLLAAVELSGQTPQQQVTQSRLRLEQIKSEREQLQVELQRAQAGARNVADELGNIERQLSASRSVIAELDFQMGSAEDQATENSSVLLLTREQHLEATAVLNRRLREVYKQGPLHTVRVLLGATSFADLLNRYRYLSTIAAYDRALVQRVEKLELEFRGRNDRLKSNLTDLQQLRRAAAQEAAMLREVERTREATLATYRATEKEAQESLESLDRDEERLRVMIDNLGGQRAAAGAASPAAGGTAPPRAGTPAGTPPRGTSAPPAGNAAAAPSLPFPRASLDWPAQGPILYYFGPERRPNGVTLRWSGIGIAAPVGSPVRAVRAGVVDYAGPMEGYGPTVILNHGGGLLTLYLHLDVVGVVQGRSVPAGQVVGTVGGADTAEGAHVEFQLRTTSLGTNQALDPLPWLKPPLR